AYRMLGAYTPTPGSTGSTSSGGNSSSSSNSSSGKTGSNSSSSASNNTSGNSGGNNRQTRIPTIVVNSPTPITTKEFNASGQARQSIPSLFALCAAKVAVTKQGSVMQQVTTTTRNGGSGGSRGSGGSSTSVSTTVNPTVVTVYNSPLADSGKLAQLLPIL